MENGPRTSTTTSSQMNSSTEEGQGNWGDSPNRGQMMFTREVIARESSCTTTSSNSSMPARKSMLKTICDVPCLIIVAIICLPEYLVKAVIYLRDLITMENCVKSLKCLLIIVPIVCGAIYCSCLCMRLSDGLSSKELTQLYETELKSLWQSQVLLEEQIHEIQGLKKKTSQLHSEINRINEGILQSVKQILEESDIPGDNKNQVLAMINLAFKKIYEDHVQMADWAQKTIGATIDTDRSSKTYEPENAYNCWFSSWFMSSAKPPDTILQPDVYPGNCWAFQGSEGHVVVKLPERIQPVAVTVQHISKTISPSGGVSSAMKDFSVYGIDDATEQEALLGTFMYDIEKEAIQTYQLKNEHSKPFLYIKFKVKSNWGNPEFTCIYRVRVHGKMANLVDPLNQGRV
ncbi:SUN domain-containing protein 3-like isoform X2 [Hemicordylus capensis]|nr:SUN domain-containing protein 3-like isoform X2 [Hemicordylus capensis]XP_053155643.1 SUN domain-containing protein 3-like isoform X2 [Hemicordylus capensis]XP_053155644.1 SUN domain-containing protein 3-like isoform X2 [Hemicordylus capensis]XP_053155645.1 SUN domain-containing protein 3-like isoform X2 [Hemicordylus capensis]